MSIEPRPTSVLARGYSTCFVLITVVFVTCLITANVTAVKLVSVLGRTLPAAIVIFPISYIFGDVLIEVYGYHRARRSRPGGHDARQRKGKGLENDQADSPFWARA